MTIGIIPCAGQATRIHGLPKFLLPVPGGYLLDTLCRRLFATTTNTYVIANSDNKYFVEQYLPENHHITGIFNTVTMSETVLKFQNICGDNIVALGMPDSYWTDNDVYGKLIHNLETTDAIVSLALFKIREGQHNYVGNCALIHETNVVAKIIDKPVRPTFPYCWGAMAWKPAFWNWIHSADQHVGFAAQRAIDFGDKASGVIMDGPYFDCGTPERYFEMIREITK